MIETDMLFAYVKKEDGLKPAANKLISRIISGEFGTVDASREAVLETMHRQFSERVPIRKP